MVCRLQLPEVPMQAKQGEHAVGKGAHPEVVRVHKERVYNG